MCQHKIMEMQKNELHDLLDFGEEPLSKKLKIVDNIYKSSELILPHKEVSLFKWILKHANQDYNKCWGYLNYWFKSAQFKKLNRNDISKEDFFSIIKLIEDDLSNMKETDKSTTKIILDSVLILINNDMFQHYFKYNTEAYCKLISLMLRKIDCCNYFKEFLKTDLFHKNIMAQEKFNKKFLTIVLPIVSDCLKKFETVEAFELSSKLIRKCLFYKNHKSFKTYITQFFEDVKIENQKIPKSLFKHLLYVYMHMIGFDLKDELVLSSPNIAALDLPKSELSLIKTQEILLVLFDVLSENNNDLDFEVNKVTFTAFIGNILKQLLYLGKPSNTSYKIFMKATDVDPLLIEPITESIIIYAVRDGHKQENQYEAFIIHIFRIFSKLRRIENFISKIVNTLYYYFMGSNKVLEEVYAFNGEIDIGGVSLEKEKISAEDIFTDGILQHFSECICNLASWQIINVFKTLLFHMRQTLNEIDKNDYAENLMENVSVLLSTFLCSLRNTKRMVVNYVAEKALKELEAMRNILQEFGTILLNRKHNETLMKSFLSVAYNWAEVYLCLEYYAFNKEIQLNKLVDNNSIACNITYLHSYLTVNQWCLISERITNFGEVACRQLLDKLYIQKLRALQIFEESVDENVIKNVAINVNTNIEIIWRDILEDEYVMENLLPKMVSSSAMFLAEKLITNTDTFQYIRDKPHLLSSSILLTALNNVTVLKMGKLVKKRKRKLNEDIPSKPTSTQISSLLTGGVLLTKESTQVIEDVKSIYYSNKTDVKAEWNINEEKVHRLCQISGKTIMYCPEEIRIIQHCKFKLNNLLRIVELCKDVIESFENWECIFSLVTENIFKDELSVEAYEPLITDFTENLLVPTYMRCCIIIINIAYKVKKFKLSKNIKSTVERYKAVICDKILDVVLENKPSVVFIDAYCCAFRHFVSNKDEEKLSRLLQSLDAYVNLAIDDTEHLESVLLFITILENKVKMQPVLGDDFLLRIWDMCKVKDWICLLTDKHAQLIKLLLGLASNEEFTTIITDLLKITEESATSETSKFLAKLKTWESVLLCDLNPIKLNTLQIALENLLRTLIVLRQHSLSDTNLHEGIFNLERNIIHTPHLPFTSPMIDMIILSATILCNDQGKDKASFNLPVTLLESLLKYRKPLIMNRLPTILKLYRILLKQLCERSDSDLNLELPAIKQVADYSHQLEKLTKNFTTCQKDMARVAMYLVADIFQQYERITLHPTVKIHLNNCVYSLLSVCDQHAIAFLMRNLSNASTELFKDIRWVKPAFILYIEVLSYYLNTKNWYKIECENPNNCLKILLVADPQLIGNNNEVIHFLTPINIFDSDRLTSTIPVYKKPRDFYDTSQIFVGLSHVPLMFKPSLFVDKVVEKMLPHVLFTAHEHKSMIISSDALLRHEFQIVPVTHDNNQKTMNCDSLCFGLHPASINWEVI
ncbi:hypothetical protein NQ315_004174 [Exocentrus adspersus]|uniref:Nucleolar 27S pre-rRNA processing Urb2/Npa2 C-terminal domain-containing protein n=1 Tax=Exocentrus adspersus TaxID=1586481 RepID=A0AAV8W7X5_9CUCU|nr:hypothetical protein NQ315_004174 [Exocentrus adspersus]